MARKKQTSAIDEETAPRERILAAAKHWFSVDGLAARVVDIVEEAGVNIGAINYYFGSKDALLQEVLESACSEVVEERMKLLAAATQATTPSVRSIIEAWIGPALRRVYSESEEGPFLLQLTRIATALESGDGIGASVRQKLTRCNEAFIDALCKLRPDLTRPSVSWRMAGMIGVMVFLGGAKRIGLKDIRSVGSNQARLEESLREIIPFLVAGFEAPPPSP